MLLRARGLRKTFTGPGGTPVPVLHGVDLEVKGGELVAVAGASGSGKSTLLNLIGLLEPPDAGEIWIGDERVSHLGRQAQCRVRGASIGYVFQSFLLLAGLTALDNVLLLGIGELTVQEGDLLVTQVQIALELTMQPAQGLEAFGEQHHAVGRIAQGPPTLGRLQVRQQPLVLAEMPGVETLQGLGKGGEIRHLLPFIRRGLTLPGE